MEPHSESVVRECATGLGDRCKYYTLLLDESLKQKMLEPEWNLRNFILRRGNIIHTHKCAVYLESQVNICSHKIFLSLVGKACLLTHPCMCAFIYI